MPATIRIYRLRNVVLDRSLMVLLKDGEVIADTVYEQSPDAVAALRVRPDSLVVADHGHAVATCCDHWDANYYHWVAHTLPTLHAIQAQHPAGNVGLMVPRLAPWQRRSLDLIGASGLTTIATSSARSIFFRNWNTMISLPGGRISRSRRSRARPMRASVRTCRQAMPRIG